MRITIYLLLAALAAPAVAWNALGHQVVARVAWNELSDEARNAAVELLLEAPEDADLAALLPDDDRPLSERRRELFSRAGYWSDIVRDRDDRERFERYHHSNWHYVNHFWETGPDGAAVPLERPVLGFLVERLEEMAPALGDVSRPAAERSIDLAWILHLVGDVHQPLHNSGRVTETEPDGDRGGNDFELADDRNLHSFWDGIFSSSYRRWFWQSEDAQVGKIARRVRAEHPPESLADELDPGAFADWSREGAATAMRLAYPSWLERDAKPPRRYKATVLDASHRAVALAGYRLAELLEGALGVTDSEPASDDQTESAARAAVGSVAPALRDRSHPTAATTPGDTPGGKGR